MKSNLKMKAAMILALGFLGVLTASAQNTLQVSMTGRVVPAYSLEPVAVVGDPNYLISVQRLGQDKVLIHLHRQASGPAAEGTVRLVLALRTNAETYRLRATSVEGSGLLIRVGEPQASGNFVAPAALASFSAQPSTVLEGQEHVIASGSRISLRGKFTSLNNALLVPVELRLASSESSSSYQILVTMGS